MCVFQSAMSDYLLFVMAGRQQAGQSKGERRRAARRCRIDRLLFVQLMAFFRPKSFQNVGQKLCTFPEQGKSH